MSNVCNMNLRFNLENAEHQKAWTYLHTMDKQEFKSYSSVIIKTVNEFFDKYYRDENDPYFETRERELEFINQIVAGVRKEIRAILPHDLMKNTMQINLTDINDDESGEEVKENVNIDWEFISRG